MSDPGFKEAKEIIDRWYNDLTTLRAENERRDEYHASIADLLNTLLRENNGDSDQVKNWDSDFRPALKALAWRAREAGRFEQLTIVTRLRRELDEAQRPAHYANCTATVRGHELKHLVIIDGDKCPHCRAEQAEAVLERVHVRLAKPAPPRPHEHAGYAHGWIDLRDCLEAALEKGDG